MTREEAIEILEDCKRFSETGDGGKYPRYYALEMAIKALEQEPCTDAISRQAVLKVLDNLKANFTCYDSVTLDEVASHVKAIPPADPKTGYWIDVDGDNAICGCCNRLNHLYGTYCKHCGARMIEEQESEKV